jgi:3-deoxy-7-phosphoheptulonate synthase
VILRGGDHGPNYDADSISAARSALEAAKLPPSLIVDASHANCGKDCAKMPEVFREIVRQRAGGDRSIVGAMLESNLVAGNQSFPKPLDQLVRGQSITDSCIGWETTEELLHEAAGML